MVFTLVWPTGPKWEMDVQLDRRVFTIRGSYNVRFRSWIMDLYAPDGSTLLSGVRVVKSYPLLPRWRDERFPPGQLFAVATREGVNRDPGRNDFDGDSPPFKLVYVDKS